MTRLVWLSVLVPVVVCAGVALADPPAFQSALTNQKLEVNPRPGEVETEAVKRFKETGENAYRGDAQAIADGKRIYAQQCALCHLPDGSGRIGPSLIGTDWSYPRVATDVGMFEVLYGGASGAMQSFAKRGMTQDQMLKVIAYVRTLAKS